MASSLQRFLDAQQRDYLIALNEIRNGQKRTHWMWYIFPQIDGLGFSETSKYYAIKNIDEAKEFLEHPILGTRFITICQVLASINGNNATTIFGSPDDMKLRSSITLFSSLPGSNSVFQAALDKFFNGMKDDKTLQIVAELNKR